MCDHIDLELMVDIINDAFCFMLIFLFVLYICITCVYTHIYKLGDSVSKAFALVICKAPNISKSYFNDLPKSSNFLP